MIEHNGEAMTFGSIEEMEEYRRNQGLYTIRELKNLNLKPLKLSSGIKLEVNEGCQHKAYIFYSEQECVEIAKPSAKKEYALKLVGTYNVGESYYHLTMTEDNLCKSIYKLDDYMKLDLTKTQREYFEWLKRTSIELLLKDHYIQIVGYTTLNNEYNEVYEWTKMKYKFWQKKEVQKQNLNKISPDSMYEYILLTNGDMYIDMDIVATKRLLHEYIKKAPK